MTLKEKLKNKQLTIGSWVTIGHPAIAEIIAKAGFDWLTVDMEHSSLTLSQAEELIRVIDLCGVTPLVRVNENNPNIIKQVMDIGAHGVIVPLINSREDAEKAVSAVKYPPTGKRGVGLTRAQSYSLDFESYRKWNRENSIVIALIEHIQAVENLEEIMSVEGMDAFIIGPYDLSGSLDCPGEFSNPRVKEALEEIYNKAQRNNYLMGQHVVDPDPEIVKEKIKTGFKFIGFGTDFLFLNVFCKKSLGEIRKSV